MEADVAFLGPKRVDFVCCGFCRPELLFYQNVPADGGVVLLWSWFLARGEAVKITVGRGSPYPSSNGLIELVEVTTS